MTTAWQCQRLHDNDFPASPRQLHACLRGVASRHSPAWRGFTATPRHLHGEERLHGGVERGASHVFLVFVFSSEVAEEHKARQRRCTTDGRSRLEEHNGTKPRLNGGGAQRTGGRGCSNETKVQWRRSTTDGRSWLQQRNQGFRGGEVAAATWSFHRFLPLLHFQALAEEQKNGTARHGRRVRVGW
ncbi:unnamed protein product [Closterium sp. Yama58-4]|nr:unnamed protein product [Closterium sp. Yama58-4]